MGQVPAKYFLPPSPYGSSTATATVNPVQPAAVSPQVPLLPPNFQDPGTQGIPGQTVQPNVRNPFGNNPINYGGPPFARGYQ